MPSKFLHNAGKISTKRFTCPKTGKNGYRQEIEAKIALANTQRRSARSSKREEQRVYRCGFCHKWHLTSTPFKKGHGRHVEGPKSNHETTDSNRVASINGNPDNGPEPDSTPSNHSSLNPDNRDTFQKILVKDILENGSNTGVFTYNLDWGGFKPSKVMKDPITQFIYQDSSRDYFIEEIRKMGWDIQFFDTKGDLSIRVTKIEDKG